MIAAFEKRFEVRVPDDLRTFLKEIAGGFPRLCVFRRGERFWEVDAYGNPFTVDGSKRPSPVSMFLLDEEARIPLAESFGEFIDGLGERPKKV